MTGHETALERLRSANPVPGIEHLDPDELAMFLSRFEERRSLMTATDLRPERAQRPDPRPGGPRRPILAAGLALVVVLALIGGLVVLFTGGEEGPVATSVPETTTTAPGATVAPTAPDPGTSGAPTTGPPTTAPVPSGEGFDPARLVWTMQPLTGPLGTPSGPVDSVEEVRPDVGVWRLTGWSGGYALFDEACSEVFLSTDLASWEVAASLGEHARCLLTATADGSLVAVVEPQPAATGPGPNKPGPPEILFSADGRSWEVRATLAAGDTVVGLAATPAGVLAAGSTGDGTVRGTQAVVWSIAVDSGEVTVLPVQTGASLNAIATNGAGLVAAGTLKGVRLSPGIWSSPDGVAWDPAELPPACLSGSIWNVTSGPAGLVAAGPCLEDPQVLRSGVFHSTDGTTWAEVTDPALAGLALVNDLASGGAGYALTGEFREVVDGVETGRAGVWVSADGSTWTRYLLGPDATSGPVIVGERSVAVVGGDRDAAVLWLGAEETG